MLAPAPAHTRVRQGAANILLFPENGDPGLTFGLRSRILTPFSGQDSSDLQEALSTVY